MDRTQSTLTDTEVSQVVRLIETLDRSTLDFLHIDSAGIKVTIGKGNAPPSAFSSAPAAPAAASGSEAATTDGPDKQVAETAATGGADVARLRLPEGNASGLVITAPMMGRYYSRPDPASPPFVTVGSEVDASTPVGMIEVMKLFNTVLAGLEGIITEICVPDGEFIEYGTSLFKLRPKNNLAEG